MKKRLFRLTIILTIIGLLFVTNRHAIENVFQPETVRAFGDIIVDFHVPALQPIFVINNMAPGQVEQRVVDVTNNGTVSRMVSVKGIKSSETGNLSTVLSIVILDGATPVYGTGSSTGAKHLSDFFTESNVANGVQLSVLTPGQLKTYTFKVTFDSAAGNDFQATQVIFDLTFGIITGDNVVINEVFYKVDAGHGLDSPADRGVTVGGLAVSIIGNGAGSVNSVFVDIDNNCSIMQTNSSSTTNVINQSSNTGGNQANGNTSSSTNITSGNISQNVTITNTGNSNISNVQCAKNKKLGTNDEWIELFNPTDHDVNLKNYTINDNSGITRTINGNRILKPGKFALIAKDNSTWNKWSEPSSVLKIPLGQQIGDGLNNTGDHLILKDAAGATVDTLSWGNDTTIFNPAIPNVATGHSLERLTPGFDNDAASDFKDQNPPTPGSY